MGDRPSAFQQISTWWYVLSWTRMCASQWFSLRKTRGRFNQDASNRVHTPDLHGYPSVRCLREHPPDGFCCFQGQWLSAALMHAGRLGRHVLVTSNRKECVVQGCAQLWHLWAACTTGFQANICGKQLCWSAKRFQYTSTILSSVQHVVFGVWFCALLAVMSYKSTVHCRVRPVFSWNTIIVSF